MNSNPLSLLGLCKRAGMLQAGEEPAEAAARARDARILLLASDAADNTARRVRHFAEEGACLWLQVPFTKEELGHAIGRLSCAIVAITDIGFAAAIVRRLADRDAERYGDTLSKLERKAERAAERKAEQRAHEKNMRHGRFTKGAPPPAEKRTGPEKRAGTRPAEKRAEAGGGEEAHRRENRSFAGPPGKKRFPAKQRPYKSERKHATASRFYSHSRPVKKGKGSFHRENGA